MQREILKPADLSGPALSELKQWLGILQTGEDQALLNLLEASVSLCEAFTGQAPLEIEVREHLSAHSGAWQRFGLHPVRTITGAELVEPDGTPNVLATDEFEIDIDANGVGSVRFKLVTQARTIAVAYTAGIASDWASLPAPLRQGIVRMAAYHYRERDMAPASSPPASVAALWRPWRTMRLA